MMVKAGAEALQGQCQIRREAYGGEGEGPTKEGAEPALFPHFKDEKIKA